MTTRPAFNEAEAIYDFIYARLIEMEKEVRRLEAAGWPEPFSSQVRIEFNYMRGFVDGLREHIRQEALQDFQLSN